ncbi:MAG: V-type ATP synthase subunit E [Candidatus Bathyarchaeota archaeon]
MSKNTESLEAMRRKIIQDAEAEALRIITQATKRADEVLEAARQESSYEEDVDRSHIRDSHQATDRERVSETMSEYTALLSSYKSEILDSIYQETLRRVKMHVDSEEYLSTMEGLIVEAGIALGGGELTVWVNQEDSERASSELLARASAEVTKVTGKAARLILSQEPLEAVGGARLVQAESKATVDNTFEGRLKRLKEQRESELENMVFG